MKKKIFLIHKKNYIFQFLEKILEISPLEISALKKKAKTDPKLELKLKNVILTFLIFNRFNFV